IQHMTGIPHNPTGQGIVERVHQVIKANIAKQEAGMNTVERDPHKILSKVLFVMNLLSLTGNREAPPVSIHYDHHRALPESEIQVFYKDISTGQWF
ncbi:IGEB protein, partial [Glaucidium brasilianum]|nr:IGEB protein [Glaucidium brasilianum]